MFFKQRKGLCRQRTVQFSMSGVQCEEGRGKQWLEKQLGATPRRSLMSNARALLQKLQEVFEEF